MDKASQILTCLALTESTPLDFIESTPNGESKSTRGRATRKKDGWFRIDLVDDRELRVREADLYNEKKYRLHDNKFRVSGKTNELLNRRIKRESKRKAQEREGLTKQAAASARETMIKNEIVAPTQAIFLLSLFVLHQHLFQRLQLELIQFQILVG